MFEKMMDSPAFKSAMRSAGTVIGREITRSIFGTGRRRRLAAETVFQQALTRQTSPAGIQFRRTTG